MVGLSAKLLIAKGFFVTTIWKQMMLSIKAPSPKAPTMPEPVNAQLPIQPPEPKKKRGRVPGSTIKNSKVAIRRLAELGFDPLEELIKLFDQVSKDLKEMRKLKEAPIVLQNGDVRRFSAMAYATLVSAQQKLANDLMRYGYARVPETVIVEKEIPRPVINLTRQGDSFEPIDVYVDDDKEGE